MRNGWTANDCRLYETVQDFGETGRTAMSEKHLLGIGLRVNRAMFRICIVRDTVNGRRAIFWRITEGRAFAALWHNKEIFQNLGRTARPFNGLAADRWYRLVPL